MGVTARCDDKSRVGQPQQELGIEVPEWSVIFIRQVMRKSS
jgi:hypothetical protein